MHRSLMKAQRGQQVDHRDRNPLNNQKSNLRFSTQAENLLNKAVRKDSASGYKGVRRRGIRWRAYIHVQGRRKHLGTYTTKVEAARAYNEAALKHHGEFAYQNEVKND